MDLNPVLMGVTPSNLLEYSDSPFYMIGDGAEFWKAAQDLIHPELDIRRAGFNQLIQSGAVTQSPLLAYLLVSRLSESDLNLRAQMVLELSKILALPFNGNPAINEVLYFIKSTLSQLRRNQILALLQLADAIPATYPQVTKIIGQCSHAGEHLAEIVADRPSDLGLRQVAVRLIGDIGYISVLPTLERIETRLESRTNASSSFSNRPTLESQLLPLLKEAIAKLR